MASGADQFEQKVIGTHSFIHNGSDAVSEMRRWFLSYNTQDHALMEALESALRQKDAGAHIFFAPKSLRAGSYFLPELAKEITNSNVFVLLVGEKGIGRWQVIEYYEAFDKRINDPSYPVVLVLHTGQAAPGLPFLHQLHRIVTSDPASEDTIGKLFQAADGAETTPGELWRHTAPYRGLAAMTESDSDFFFGRGRETVDVINVLAGSPDKLPILLGNSGVGKSSLAQAGIMAALTRQGWPDNVSNAGPWPQVFQNSRGWCFLTVRPGVEPIKALTETFLETWQLDRTSTEWPRRRAEWVEDLLGGKLNLRDLLDQTERRYAELQQPKPLAFFLYIDQGEELYVRAEERHRRRFSEFIAQALGDPRLRVLMSLRADFSGALQNDEPLFEAYYRVEVPPLREAQLREVVSRPAEVLSARFETDHLAADIARRTAEESTKDAGALPLLSYLLDDMWSAMVAREDGMLRLPAAAIELGSVLVGRANAFLSDHPQSEETLRRLLTLKLATVRQDGEPTRRRALRSEFTDEEWRLVSELADHPNRLLVTATPEGGVTHAEVAHEAIFRRWEKLREWIAAEREFLIWKSGLEGDRHGWDAAPTEAKADALLMGLKLAQAQSWLATRAPDLPKPDREFIEQSIKRDALEREQRKGLRRRTHQMAALAGMLVLGIAGLAWSNWDYLGARAVMLAEKVWPKVLTADAERAAAPGQAFKECADCPEMVAVPAGEFMMGSPNDEKGRNGDEDPQHKVTIAQPFAVSRFEITSDELYACGLLGGCVWSAPDTGSDRGMRPVMNVSWDDAQQYVAWLSKRTGKLYRLLSEAEWEYAARAGSVTGYSWGDEIGKSNANCIGCGSPWVGSHWTKMQTAPVGSFAANAFGLHDMHGNVSEWTEDCYHEKYDGAPPDGSAWTAGDCTSRVVRGGSWLNNPGDLRSANRSRLPANHRSDAVGFRVGRTFNPYSKVGDLACFDKAEYPDSWRKESTCTAYGCRFGKMSLDACLALGVRKGSKTVIYGNTGTSRADECWLQHSCGDLRPYENGVFTLFKM